MVSQPVAQIEVDGSLWDIGKVSGNFQDYAYLRKKCHRHYAPGSIPRSDFGRDILVHEWSGWAEPNRCFPWL
jgi:hypothetical protein